MVACFENLGVFIPNMLDMYFPCEAIIKNDTKNFGSETPSICWQLNSIGIDKSIEILLRYHTM